MADWNEEYQQTFDKLKELSTHTPMLAHEDYSKPFEVQEALAARCEHFTVDH